MIALSAFVVAVPPEVYYTYPLSGNIVRIVFSKELSQDVVDAAQFALIKNNTPHSAVSVTMGKTYVDAKFDQAVADAILDKVQYTPNGSVKIMSLGDINTPSEAADAFLYSCKRKHADSKADSMEDSVLLKLNQERLKTDGLSALATDDDLSLLARLWSDDVIATGMNQISYVSDTYGQSVNFLEEFEYKSQAFGMNLGDNQDTVDKIFNTWMADENAKELLLRPVFTHMAIGMSNIGYKWTMLMAKLGNFVRFVMRDTDEQVLAGRFVSVQGQMYVSDDYGVVETLFMPYGQYDVLDNAEQSIGKIIANRTSDQITQLLTVPVQPGNAFSVFIAFKDTGVPITTVNVKFQYENGTDVCNQLPSAKGIVTCYSPDFPDEIHLLVTVTDPAMVYRTFRNKLGFSTSRKTQTIPLVLQQIINITIDLTYPNGDCPLANVSVLDQDKLLYYDSKASCRFVFANQEARADLLQLKKYYTVSVASQGYQSASKSAFQKSPPLKVAITMHVPRNVDPVVPDDDPVVPQEEHKETILEEEEQNKSSNISLWLIVFIVVGSLLILGLILLIIYVVMHKDGYGKQLQKPLTKQSSMKSLGSVASLQQLNIKASLPQLRTDGPKKHSTHNGQKKRKHVAKPGALTSAQLMQ